MKINKKILILITLLLFINNIAKADKIKVITTFTIIADMARNVAGDKIIIESITRPNAEIHFYKPTPKDIIKVKQADAILWNGLNLEQWFKKFVSDVKLKKYLVTEGIKPISIYSGKYQGFPNPHAWMSISNGLIYIDNIRKAFIELDPSNKKIYEKNADNYKQKLKSIKDNLTERIKNIPKKQRYLATSEGAFSYLANDLDFKELYLWAINTEQQGTPKQKKKMIDNIKKYNIPVIFSESTVSPIPAKQVAKETNILYGGALYVDSLSNKNGPVPDYLTLLEVTTDTIANGFEKSLKN